MSSLMKQSFVSMQHSRLVLVRSLEGDSIRWARLLCVSWNGDCVENNGVGEHGVENDVENGGVENAGVENDSVEDERRCGE